ncbi:transcription factor S-II, central domain-containing protein [Geopyxis carbonaria]|nr:transcription factor S-II, central domain-containing protein [Geopyxis carbonaria]
MDAKDVKTHVSQIEKAVRERLPTSHLLDLLSSLKNEVVATEALLRETRVGMAVNKLRSNADKQISDLAKEIVGKWKKDVQKKPQKPPQARKSSTASPTMTSTQLSPLKPSGKKPASKASVDPSKRSKITDNVNYKCTGDKVRDNCVGVLYDGMCVDSDTGPDRLLELATAIEAQIFANHKNKLDAPYKRRIQSLYLNLKDKKNADLRKRVVAGELSVTRLATMESKEMASEERQLQDAAIQAENMREAMTAKDMKSYSDQLTCGKCRQKKVSYTQAQTRSADEPMTTFCTCEHCGNMWKFS